MKPFRCASRGALAAAAAIGLWASEALAESADVHVPGALVFFVTDVGTGTSGSASTLVSFSNASLTAGKALRISIKAEVSDFSAPAGSTVPAASVSWTTSNASGGTGSGGSLSSSSYTPIFESTANPSSGSVDLSWQLSAPGSGIRAGNHSLTLRWKIESFTP